MRDLGIVESHRAGAYIEGVGFIEDRPIGRVHRLSSGVIIGLGSLVLVIALILATYLVAPKLF